MAYGFRSRTKSASSAYRRRYSRFGRPFAYKAQRSRVTFNRKGFTKCRPEKKYRDMAMACAGWAATNTGLDTVVNRTNGYQWRSSNWAKYDYNGASTGATTNNDLLKYVESGTTVSSRIGNKINVKYIKGVITMNGAKVSIPNASTIKGQNGESTVTDASEANSWQYLRTTWRIAIVKDLQVNNIGVGVGFDDVFEASQGTSLGDTAGVHSELKVANMGRFRILSDKIVETSAIDPQLSMKYMISGSKIGSIRYNSDNVNALTNNGIYIVVAAYINGTLLGEAANGLVVPNINYNTRLCFTDE